MKKIILTLLLGMFVAISFAGEFMTDANKAFETAKKENKYVLAVFSGSDWCPPCIQLEKNVISKDEFFEQLDKKYVFLFVDFPRRKAISRELKIQNDKLAKKYDLKFYPTLMILDADGGLVLKTGVQGRSVDTFMSWFGNVSQAAIAKYETKKKIKVFL